MRWPLLVVLVASCVPAPAPTPAPATAPATTSAVLPPSAPGPEAPPPPSSPAPPTPAPPAPPPEPTVPAVRLRTWTQAIAQPAVSLAVGKRRVAALTVEGPGKPVAVWMRDGTKWRELPLPSKVRPAEGSEDHLRVFFGRDDRPRLMGWRDHGGSLSQRYYRWKGNWRDKAGEIGRLDGDPPAALFGILGHDDPEVVCKLGDVCIIKRLTGWTEVPVPTRIHVVEITAEKAYAVAEGSALHIGKKDKAWRTLSPEVPWTQSPRALWPFADGSLWVTDGERLFRWDGARWSTEEPPIEGPQKLWGAAPDDLWLAGDGGVAHWDGARWARSAALEGSFVDVIGGADEVFVAGPGGVWRAAPKGEPAPK